MESIIGRSLAVSAGLMLYQQAADALPGWSEVAQVTGVGWEGQGAGMALGELNGNRRPDMVLMAYDNPPGENSFRYKIGWDLDSAGRAGSWSNAVEVPGPGREGRGAGLALANLDADPRSEMVVAAYDSGSGTDVFRVRIGWNLSEAGIASAWSEGTEIPGLGREGQGAAVKLVGLDDDPRPEMILVAYDGEARANSFRYRIGWNVNAAGQAAAWSDPLEVPGVGWAGQGAGTAFADLDGNGRPEMVLMAYDSPDGPNSFRYKVGWNLTAAGRALSWSRYVQVPGVGGDGQGADISIADLDGNGRLEMLLMAYDNPHGANTFRYRVGSDLLVVNDFLISLSTLGHTSYRPPSGIPDSSASQTAPNLYQLSDPVVLQTAYEALQEYVNDCRAHPAAHAVEVDDPASLTFYDVLNDSDAMVAAVAWFVDRNMRWSDDGTNRTVFSEGYDLNYDPGRDFPIPANYTIRYTGAGAFGSPARFHGDSEDHAILRAAMLRSLGFNPDYLWNVINDPVSHEYNLVAYRGALRIMDYGTIDTSLALHTWNAHKTYYGYSESHGTRGTGSARHNDLVRFANNYPGGAPACSSWSYRNYYQDTCP